MALTETSGRKLHQFPLVRSFMTPAPPSAVQRRQSLSSADRLMRERHIPQVPVVEGATVVGLLSQRDVLMAEMLPGVNSMDVKVDEVMTAHVFSTTPDAPLAEVVTEMQKRGVASVAVVEDGRCVGFFTANEALTALAELLTEPE
ncbi:MAG TPA: CBS domain-containing protein [Polyangia bacterium]